MTGVIHSHGIWAWQGLSIPKKIDYWTIGVKLGSCQNTGKPEWNSGRLKKRIPFRLSTHLVLQGLGMPQGSTNICHYLFISCWRFFFFCIFDEVHSVPKLQIRVTKISDRMPKNRAFEVQGFWICPWIWDPWMTGKKWNKNTFLVGGFNPFEKY